MDLLSSQNHFIFRFDVNLDEVNLAESVLSCNSSPRKRLQFFPLENTECKYLAGNIISFDLHSIETGLWAHHNSDLRAYLFSFHMLVLIPYSFVSRSFKYLYRYLLIVVSAPVSTTFYGSSLVLQHLLLRSSLNLHSLTLELCRPYNGKQNGRLVYDTCNMTTLGHLCCRENRHGLSNLSL